MSAERSGIAAYLARSHVLFTEDDLDDCAQSIELECLENPAASRDACLHRICSAYCHQWHIDRGEQRGPQDGLRRKHMPEYPDSFLAYLTHHQRSVAALLPYDLTISEIGDRLGITGNHVRVLSHRIRLLYKRYLKTGYPFLKRCIRREPIKIPPPDNHLQENTYLL